MRVQVPLNNFFAMLVISISGPRRHYKRLVGDANHAYATILVALANIPAEPVVPEDLALDWTGQNPEHSLDTARDAAKRAVLGLIAASIDEYLGTLVSLPSILPPTLATETADTRMLGAKLTKLFDANDYEESDALIRLLLYWRNREFHSGAQDATKEIEKLERNKPKIETRYPRFDVTKAISHCRLRTKPSNIDILTLLQASHRFVAQTDEFFLRNINPRTFIRAFLGDCHETNKAALKSAWAKDPDRRKTWMLNMLSHHGLVETGAPPAGSSPDFTAAIDEAIALPLNTLVP